jgi:hypothetical protein
MPRSIVDIGCGVGTWVKTALALGVEHAIGVDGEYVEKAIIIPPENFIPANLEFSLPDLGRFDLLISLEVAEHLHRNRASGFIQDICKMSDVVLFSAAIPYQGGTNHINENWPEYWAKLFYDNKYVPLDILRDRLWDNSDIEWWYRQNILLFVRSNKLKKIFSVKPVENINCLSRVHPELFLKKTHRCNPPRSSDLIQDIEEYRKL